LFFGALVGMQSVRHRLGIFLGQRDRRTDRSHAPREQFQRDGQRSHTASDADCGFVWHDGSIPVVANRQPTACLIVGFGRTGLFDSSGVGVPGMHMLIGVTTLGISRYQAPLHRGQHRHGVPELAGP
jgi:hypothetical protein